MVHLQVAKTAIEAQKYTNSVIWKNENHKKIFS